MFTIRLALVITVAVVAAGCIGPFGGSAATPTATIPANVPEGLETVWEVWRTLQEEFIEKDQLSVDEISEAAIEGILEALDDPFSSYLSPGEFEIFSDLSGRFEGIGAEVTVQDEQIVIVAPLPGTPASQAGVLPGDIILAVDGTSITDKTLLEVVLLIRGPKGTPVTLQLLRLDSAMPQEVTIVRDTIEITAVTRRLLEPGIGYVQISSFDEPTTEDLRDALEWLEDRGMVGLLLDLRNNPGGLLDTAVGVASQFLDDGLVLQSIGPDGERTDFRVESGGAATDIPMVVLVNGFSASASEVVTGALQDHGRATVVGTQTFGKGTVNLLKSLSNGGGLNFTISRWLTPQGRLIQGVGIEPDVLVGDTNPGVANRRLRTLAFPLCAAYNELQEQNQGQSGFIQAIQQLCSLPPDPGTGEQADLQLQFAVSVLKEQIDLSP